MTVLDRIKPFFRRAKPGAKAAEEKPPEVTREKPAKTTEPQRKAPKAIRKKVPRASKRKRGGTT